MWSDRAVTTTEPGLGPVPRTLLAVGGDPVRAVLRRVDSLLAEQATRNAAGCLAQEAAARRDHERTLADLTVLERKASATGR
jgi:hypothetical protein